MLKRLDTKQIWVVTAVWVCVILAVLLMPAPREWGTFGKWLGPRYDHIRPILQPMAHFMLMGVLALMLMRCFAARRIQQAVLWTIGIALGLSSVFELLQFLLPPSFGRACDLVDIACSVAGAVLGCSISLRSTGYIKK